MQEAIIIPLEFWQDPVNDVILVYSTFKCSIFFNCWRAAGEPADFVGHLSFENASSVRSAQQEGPPYRIPVHSHHSYILEIPNSDLVRQYIETQNLWTPEFPLQMSDRHHFVVFGHDIYHEIVAASFTATTIPIEQVTDTTLRPLIDRA